MHPVLAHRGDHADPAGRPLHWARAGEDLLPFRGDPLPLRGAEYEARVAPVAEFRNATFDTADPAQNEQYRAVMTRCVNRWYVLLQQRFVGPTTVYLEWVERYLEDVGDGRGRPPGR